jgi:hypothetical protein
MNSILYIKNISNCDFIEFANKASSLFGDLIIDSNGREEICHNNAILLSQDENWDVNHNEVLKIMSLIAPHLAQLSKLGASFEISIVFNMKEYRHRSLYSFIFINTFAKTLAEFDMKLKVTIVLDKEYLSNKSKMS